MILSLQRLLQAATAVAAGRSDAELRAEVDALEKEAMLRFREWSSSSGDTPKKGVLENSLNESQTALNRSLDELYGLLVASVISELDKKYASASVSEMEAARLRCEMDERDAIMSFQTMPNNPRMFEARHQIILAQEKTKHLRELISAKTKG